MPSYEEFVTDLRRLQQEGDDDEINYAIEDAIELDADEEAMDVWVVVDALTAVGLPDKIDIALKLYVADSISESLESDAMRRRLAKAAQEVVIAQAKAVVEEMRSAQIDDEQIARLLGECLAELPFFQQATIKELNAEYGALLSVEEALEQVFQEEG